MGAISWVETTKNINIIDKSFPFILFQQKTTVGLNLDSFSRIDFSYASFEKFLT